MKLTPNIRSMTGPRSRFRCTALSATLLLLGGCSGCTAKEDSTPKATAGETNLADRRAVGPSPTTPTRAVAAETGSSATTKPAEITAAAPAKSTPVVYGAAELAKVLDFTKLKLPKGTTSFDLTPAHANIVAPGTVKTVWPVYMAQFNEMGWKSTGGPREQISDDYASTTIAKDNFLAEISVSKKGDTPETMVSLLWHGNLDTRALPRNEGAKAIFESQSGTGYTTEKNVADTHAELIELLMADGWQPYGRLGRGQSEGNEKENRFAHLFKSGYHLDVMIGLAPAQNNKTMVQYNVYALSHEIPVPPGASDVEFDDNKWELKCKAPGDFLAVAELYKKAMLAAGLKALPGEQPQEKYVNQRFGTEAGDIVMVQTSVKDDQTHVLVSGISAAMLAEIKKQDKERAETEIAAAEEQQEADRKAATEKQAVHDELEKKIDKQQADLEKQIQDKVQEALKKAKLK